MAKNFLTRLTHWQNYVHYALLGIITSLIVYYFELYGLAPVKMVIIFIGLLFIVDTAIHGLFWVLPKPLRWRA